MLRQFMIPLACCIGLIIGAGAPAPAAGAEGLQRGDVFPVFKLQRSDGSTLQLSDYDGQPKLLMFWATWCPYCRKLMPAIIDLHDEFGPSGLKVVAVNFRDDGDTEAYAREMGIDFDIVLQGDDLAARTGVQGTPTVFVLDGQNRVRLRTSDSDPENPDLRQAVIALLPAKAPLALRALDDPAADG